MGPKTLLALHKQPERSAITGDDKRRPGKSMTDAPYSLWADPPTYVRRSAPAHNGAHLWATHPNCSRACISLGWSKHASGPQRDNQVEVPPTCAVSTSMAAQISDGPATNGCGSSRGDASRRSQTRKINPPTLRSSTIAVLRGAWRAPQPPRSSTRRR